MIFLEEKAISAGIFGFLALGLIGRMLLGALYRHLIRETDNMATTTNRALRQCKLKFSNCYRLGNGVPNVPVFVDKFLDHLTIGIISYETVGHLAGQSVLLSVVCAGVGVCRGILAGHSIGEILPYYIVSFFGLYLYFSVTAVADVRMQKRILKTNLVDYLENHLAARIDVTDDDMEMLYGREKARGSRRSIEVMTFPTGRARELSAEPEPPRAAAHSIPAAAHPLPAAVGGEDPEPHPYGQIRVTDEELRELLKEFV